MKLSKKPTMKQVHGNNEDESISVDFQLGDGSGEKKDLYLLPLRQPLMKAVPIREQMKKEVIVPANI